MLYIIATPIGNLEDITFRAIRTLKEVDFVLAEDTRTSSILLRHYEIKTPMRSFHSHSSDRKVEDVIAELKSGKNVALISDAGTPGISDPAFRMITEAIRQNIVVVPIPGPSAVVAAVSASGAPIDKFLFLGFLPLKKGRQTILHELKNYKYSFVIYESPYRVAKTLQELYNVLGNRFVSVCREMTKKFEEFSRGNLEDIIADFKIKPRKGEFTIVVAPEGYSLNHKNEGIHTD